MAEPEPDAREQDSKLEESLKQLDLRTFEKVPEDARLGFVRLVSAIVAEAKYSGPLPRASEFAKYKEVLADAPDRILTMAENQSAHRIRMEEKVSSAQIKQSDRGQFLAFITAIVSLAASVCVTLAGQPWVGGILGGSTVLGLVSVFITGKWQQRQELEKKRTPELPEPDRNPTP